MGTLAADNSCWSCGTVFDAASDLVEKNEPSPDDVTICFYCCSVGIFTKDLIIRQPTQDEMEELLKDKMLVEHMLVVRLVGEEMRRGGTNRR